MTRYFPASPVQNGADVGGNTSNGGAESWIELSKALNTLGDARLSTPCNVLKWAVGPMALANGGTYNILPEFDYRYQPLRTDLGSFGVLPVESAVNAFCGNQGSCCFAMAIDLETTNGGEISGLNAEEQSDISLIARWSAAQGTGFIMSVYTYIDSMIVLRENNVIFLLIIGFGANSIM